MSEERYLDVQVVCSKLAEAGVHEDEVGRVYAARLEPENLKDPKSVDLDKKIVLAAKTFEGKVMLVLARFGTGRPLVKNHPLDEGGPDWRPRFLAVHGPFSMDEAGEKAKELTA